MQYESNIKHKKPWQRGRRGSLCPAELCLTMAQALLSNSVLVGSKRYAVHKGKAYCALQHGNDLWHGYPVGWVEVPETLRRRWISQNRLRRQDVRKHWDN